MKAYHVKNIDWDTDGPKPAYLPPEIVLILSDQKDQELDDAGDGSFADLLSDEYGYCINSMDVIPLENTAFVEPAVHKQLFLRLSV